MPLSLLISVFQPTRLNSLVWRLGIVAFFPLITSKLFSLSLSLSLSPTRQIHHDCSLPTPDYSRLATLSSYAIFRYRFDPSWLTSRHTFFRSDQVIFLLWQDPLGASLLLSQLLHFISFQCRLFLLSPALFSFPALFLKLVCRPDAERVAEDACTE